MKEMNFYPTYLVFQLLNKQDKRYLESQIEKVRNSGTEMGEEDAQYLTEVLHYIYDQRNFQKAVSLYDNLDTDPRDILYQWIQETLSKRGYKVMA